MPEAEFDLVHTRLVLVHVPERLEALRRLVRSLRPGGWLLVEDPDGTSIDACLDPQTDDEHLANRMRDGIRRLLEARGADMAFGRRLLRLLRAEGLVNVIGDGYQPITDVVRLLERANILQLRDMFLEHEVVTTEEFDHYLARLDDPTFVLAGPLLMAAWGRRPGN